MSARVRVRQVLPAKNRQVLPAKNRQVLPAKNRQVLPAKNRQVLPANIEDRRTAMAKVAIIGAGSIV